MAKHIIELKKIDMSFNGVKVLDQVDFALEKGEVHALVGGNGAGKSTLMKIMTGVYMKDAGEIIFDGSPVHFRSPQDAEKLGIAMIFQEFSLAPTMTVTENIFLNREFKKRNGLIDNGKCTAEARRIFSELNVAMDPGAVMSDLAAGQWQMTEIAKALATDAKVLVMDEPTSCLTENEVGHLFSMIRELKKKGIAIVYISHRMKEIYQVCDRISILADGKNVVTADTSEITMEQMIRGITGKNVDKFEWQDRKTPVGERIVLRASGIKTNNQVENVDLTLREGEVLGISGLGGSGTSETLRALFGIDPLVKGTLTVNGEEVRFRNPSQAMKKGLALIPEDRRVEGLLVDHSVKDNILLPSLDKLSNRVGVVDEKKSVRVVNDWTEELRIKTDSMNKLVRLLSGGNQQKIVFAKWLANEPQIILMDEPTKGIDIGSKAEIMDIIRGLARDGKSVVMASSELAEILAICDRILIMHQGKVIRELMRAEIDSEEELQHEIQNF